MKHTNILFKMALMLLLILATSCIEHYQIKTKVLKDGSLIRIISVTGDSTSLFEGRIKMPKDSSWQTDLTWEYEHADDTTSQKRYTYSATKHFENVDSLNDFLNDEKDSSNFTIIKTKLERKFRWFYTYFNYSELYKKEFPFNYYPVDSFVTDAQLGFLYDDDYTYSKKHDSLIHIKDLTQMPALSSGDSLRLEELEIEIIHGLAEWQARNVMEEYLELILKIKPEIQLTSEEKESLFQNSNITGDFLLDNPTHSGGNPFSSIAGRFGLTEDSIEVLLPVQLKQFEDKMEFFEGYFDSHEIRNQIELPGLILNSNADSISNTISYWIYGENRYFAKDYTLYAESRILNQWAFIASGALVVVLLSLLVVGFIRR